MQHMPSPPPLRRHFRQTRDRLATALITAGGIGVIAAVMAIGVFLAVEVVPLFWSSSGDAPRINLETLWLPQTYEGHQTPVHRWQPAMAEGGGEPRFGMLPLVWGTLEAAIWALVIAVPLALGAAAHSALFMSRRLRARIRPTLELMEAMPGVVIGFVAGLVLAPWLDVHLAQGMTLLFMLPLGLLLAGGLWAQLGAGLRRRLPMGWAALWLLPWLLLFWFLSSWLAPLLEAWWFGGDLRTWLEVSLGLDYTNRNAIIVGMAMGFAVVPSIYALAEDALSGVPKSLVEGAEALGATRWQTLWKVVLPAAGPGVLSAVMIGAGRAVGETMIVLMASGNTALMTASPLDGLRSMAASIAIELPEAAPGGTHYRLLLLAALLLFVFTFCVNTLAEVVRARLRRRYRRMEGVS
ncbi:ABC transporter permease subunit [Halomonas elongata]|uniref:Phosphate transport system permease protein PstC n=1 Tax=Halomonas elongata TaxID=2746 RepID=A0A1B8NZ79_HALEL|nr:ABC transporter permease subunit [Halomonas elongata]MBW5800291.1 ABC transporter permease subunit [Halomonas elongata]OBX35331.1 phosphate transport system permease protein PstC [Halomonas elongata]